MSFLNKAALIPYWTCTVLLCISLQIRKPMLESHTKNKVKYGLRVNQIS
jgi:hypothetical protein